MNLRLFAVAVVFAGLSPLYSGQTTATQSQGALPTETDKKLDLDLWEAIRDSANPDLYEDYLRRFPQGNFAAVARERLNKLRGGAASGAAAIRSPVPASATPVTGAPPDALSLLHKVQEAMGGAQRLAAIRNFRRTSRGQAKDGISARVSGVMTWCAPGAFLLEQGKVLEYSDGKSPGWHYARGYTQPLSPEFGRSVNFGQLFHLLLADSLPDHKITLAGPNLLQIDDGFGDRALLEIDNSNLPVSVRPSRMDAEPITYSDWREVNGVKLPHHERVARKEMAPFEWDLLWKLNTDVNCLDLGRQPKGAKPAKPRPAAPVSNATPLPTLTGDTSARAAALLKRLQEKIGGTDRLMNIRDYERVFRVSYPTTSGAMSHSSKIVETACITGEYHQKAPIGKAAGLVTIHDDVFFDGNHSAWEGRGSKFVKLPGPAVLMLQQDSFNYDVFNMALSDHLPGRELSLVDEQTLQIVDEKGNVAVVTVDPATGLPLKKVSRFFGKDRLTAPLEEHFFEWKPVGGILLPFRLTGYQNGHLQREVQIDEWKMNTGVNCSELGRPPR